MRHNKTTNNMKISERFARNKVYMDRSRGYLAWPQFVAIMYTSTAWTLEKNHIHLLGVRPAIAAGIVVAILLVLLLILGRLEFRWGIFQAENKRHSETNPVTMEILDRLRKIEEHTNFK